jgi:hypothetical protein
VAVVAPLARELVVTDIVVVVVVVGGVVAGVGLLCALLRLRPGSDPGSVRPREAAH